ncbi:hypothetical protein AC578_1290 [Pseudocercospora eumusae]|uniref:Uncharacterized protein n=1 Tax=Pseudocercospora eumusae TaxID=321146 RepID=A0A139HUP2_9PEZI|nr:hypothetical protein AC578_1290 [Pseudocercospora eumusae]
MGPFSHYDRVSEKATEKLDLNEMDQIIKKTAPTWYNLLQRLPSNRWHGLETIENTIEAQEAEANDNNAGQGIKSEANDEAAARKEKKVNNDKYHRIKKRIGVIAQIIARSIAIKTASQFGKALGLYLYTGQQNRRGTQALGSSTKQLNITASYIAIHEFLDRGLIKDMLDRTNKLNPRQIMRGITNDKYKKAMSLYHIDQSLGTTFPELGQVFKGFNLQSNENGQIDPELFEHVVGGNAKERCPWRTNKLNFKGKTQIISFASVDA